jgi:hypothetical protein
VKLTSAGPVVAATASVAIILLVPVLFALGVIRFAPGRRQKALGWLAVPLILGAILLLAGDCVGLGGAWLLIPSAQICLLYAVAEAFLRLSRRELNNAFEDFLSAQRSMESLICTIALVLITFMPSWFFYRLFVVHAMCRACCTL